jgi:hypothetical protein
LAEKYFELKAQYDEARLPVKELEKAVDEAKCNILLAMGGATRAKSGNKRFKVSTSNYTMPARECERTTFKGLEYR